MREPPGEFRRAAPFCTHPPPKGAAPSTPPGKRIGLYLTQTGAPSVSHLAGASVGDGSSMGGRSGGSAALSQTQWRHAVSVDGVGRVVQVRVGGTAQRQDRPVLGPSVGTPPETGASASSASIANGSRQRILQSPVSTGLEKTRHSPLFHLRGYQSLRHRTVQPHPQRTLVSLFNRRQHLEVRGRAPPGGARVQRQLASEHRAGAPRRHAPQRIRGVAPLVSPTVVIPTLTQVEGGRLGPFEQRGAPLSQRLLTRVDRRIVCGTPCRPRQRAHLQSGRIRQHLSARHVLRTRTATGDGGRRHLVAHRKST